MSCQKAFGQTIQRERLDLFLSGVIDKKTPHLHSDYSEEMAPIPPINLSGVQEPYKTLIYQITFLHRMVRTLAAQAASSKLAEIWHEQPKELFFRIRVPVPPSVEKYGKVLVAGGHSLSCLWWLDRPIIGLSRRSARFSVASHSNPKLERIVAAHGNPEHLRKDCSQVGGISLFASLLQMKPSQFLPATSWRGLGVPGIR